MEQLGSCGCQNGRVKLESNLILEGGVGGGKDKEGEREEGLAVSSAGEVRERCQLSSPLCVAVRFALFWFVGRLGTSSGLLLWAAARPPPPPQASSQGCGCAGKLGLCFGLFPRGTSSCVPTGSRSRIHQTGLRSTGSIAARVSNTGVFYQVFKRTSSPNYYPYFTDWKTEAQRSCPGSQS